jgi:uncharacterized surface protein with fasciclin (FAS1) repeats
MKASLIKHLVVKNVLQLDQLKQESIDKWGGEKLDITVIDDGIHVAFGKNVALILRPDMVASNGIIHPIDKVLV